MQPFLMRGGDFDPLQIAIIVIFVLASFIKWLWENWQLKRDASKRDLPADPEEQRLREAAWRKQAGQSGGQPPPIPPPVVAASPWEELRKAWKELQEAAKPAPPVPVARPARSAPSPPLVSQQRAQPVRSPTVPASTPLIAATPAPAAVAKETYFPQQKTTSVSVLAALHNLRRDPALMRQAILMQEILGPPKALQTSGDLAI
jgi:hypothetical protein|uniref:hypothetical protein n=1 Tax=Prosthecobacter sp. TaxID=1965333 RepID=UPI0037845012